MCMNKGESYQRARQAVGTAREAQARKPVDNAAPAGSAIATAQPQRRRNLLASGAEANNPNASLLSRSMRT